MSTEELALEQMRVNRPEIESGQVWKIVKATRDYSFPDELRIVCRYPFTGPQDGRVWIVEDDAAVSSLLRCPELTLRQLYELSSEAGE